MINSICQSTTVRQPKRVSATILKYFWSLDNSNTLPQTKNNIEIGHIGKNVVIPPSVGVSVG